MGNFLAIVGLLGFVVAVTMLAVRLIAKKGPLSYRYLGIIAVVSVVMFFAGAVIEGPSPDHQRDHRANSVSNEEVEEIKDKEKDNEGVAVLNGRDSRDVDLNITGDMSLKVEDDTLIAKLKSNMPDGAIFEILIMTGTDVLIAEASMKDGELTEKFQIPNALEPCYISGTAMLDFDNYQQPQNIRDIYGEKGEKMTGSLVLSDENFGIIEIKAEDVAYPSEDIINVEKSETFNQAIKDYIAISDGLILSIEPRAKDSWGVVYVAVSDGWYWLADYEKERLAESIGDYVSNLVVTSGKQSHTGVYLVDQYGKKVATPKLFGGYKVE